MRAFALDVIDLIDSLLRSTTSDVLGKQLLRAATSVGANYRAACRARSRAEFIAKLGIVEEEADESQYWIDLLHARQLISSQQFHALTSEANELVAITVASINTAR
jgi:four helix bundle protein